MAVTVESLSAFLGWSLVINLAVLILSFLTIRLGPPLLSNLQAKLMGLDVESTRKIYLKVLGTYEILIIFFNLVPYLTLRIVF